MSEFSDLFDKAHPKSKLQKRLEGNIKSRLVRRSGLSKEKYDKRQDAQLELLYRFPKEKFVPGTPTNSELMIEAIKGFLFKKKSDSKLKPETPEELHLHMVNMMKQANNSQFNEFKEDGKFKDLIQFISQPSKRKVSIQLIHQLDTLGFNRNTVASLLYTTAHTIGNDPTFRKLNKKH